MADTQIVVGGQRVNSSDVTLPPSGRKFRDHWVLNGDVIEVDWDAALASAREKATMERGKFALAAADAGWISEAEAISWAGGTAIPAWVENIIDTEVPESERLRIKIDVLTNPKMPRLGLLMEPLKAATNATDDILDQIYGIDVKPDAG